MLTLHLDRHWTCTYIDEAHKPPPLLATGESVPQLDGWHFDNAHGEPTAWLERQFTLRPTDDCVQYVLQVAAAPAGTQVIVNGHNLGTIDAPCALDITAYVSLDDNQIAFCVEHGHQGAFRDVRLQAVPCE